MQDFEHISQDLVKSLSLQYEPLGVTLYRESDPLPQDINLTGTEFKSYCHALVRAGQGGSLLLEGAQMGCKLGTSVLGFEQEMERYLDDGVLEKYGPPISRPCLPSKPLPRWLFFPPTAKRSCGSFMP